jgi:hypothetical protein
MNATATNHPTAADRKAIREMADRIGPAELLRLAAGVVANDHPDMHKGTEYRERVNLIASAYVADVSAAPAALGVGTRVRTRIVEEFDGATGKTETLPRGSVGEVSKVLASKYSEPVMYFVQFGLDAMLIYTPEELKRDAEVIGASEGVAA